MPTDPDAPLFCASHIDATTELRVSLDVCSDGTAFATITLEDLDPAGPSRCLDLGPDPARWWALATMATQVAMRLAAVQRTQERDAA